MRTEIQGYQRFFFFFQIVITGFLLQLTKEITSVFSSFGEVSVILWFQKAKIRFISPVAKEKKNVQIHPTPKKTQTQKTNT